MDTLDYTTTSTTNPIESCEEHHEAAAAEHHQQVGAQPPLGEISQPQQQTAAPALIITDTTKTTTNDKENKENAPASTPSIHGLKVPLLNVVAQQQKLIEFEPFEFKDGCEATFDEDEDDDEEQEENVEKKQKQPAIRGANEQQSALLQAALRRQSLFKLREKINGKVSRHVNEIEKRKLSPYRFSHSPLKQPRKLFKVSAAADMAVSPKTPLIVQETKNMVRAAVGQICRPSGRLGRQQISRQASGATTSSGRLRGAGGVSGTSLQASSSSGFTSNLSSIAENVSSVGDMSSLLSMPADESMRKTTTNSGSTSGNKHILMSTQLKCTTEAIDL